MNFIHFLATFMMSDWVLTWFSCQWDANQEVWSIIWTFLRFLHTLRLNYANCDRFVTQQNGPYNPIFGPFLPKKIHEKGSQFEQQVILFATEQFSSLKLKQLKCYKIPKLPKSRFRAGPPFCDTDLKEVSSVSLENSTQIASTLIFVAC